MAGRYRVIDRIEPGARRAFSWKFIAPRLGYLGIPLDALRPCIEQAQQIEHIHRAVGVKVGGAW